MPSPSTVSGSWGRERVAGPNTGWAPSGTENVDWWHGHSSFLVCCWYNPTGQPACVHTFENPTYPWGPQDSRPGRVTTSLLERRMRIVFESSTLTGPSGDTLKAPPN